MRRWRFAVEKLNVLTNAQQEYFLISDVWFFNVTACSADESISKIELYILPSSYENIRQRRVFLYYFLNLQKKLYKTLDKLLDICYNEDVAGKLLYFFTISKLRLDLYNFLCNLLGDEGMKKSIYSLVLMDDVVEAVDRMAYAMHTSRSNLINQILAEHLSCVTPEMRMQTVFSRMEEQIMQQFRIVEQTSAHVMALQSPLSYKYKPTIQYSVELYRSRKDGGDGRLRVQLRTQSKELLVLMDRFFRFWILLEQKYVPGAEDLVYQITPGRLERTIRNPLPEDEVGFGEMLVRYLQRLDGFIKAYLAGIAYPNETMVQLESQFYREMKEEKLYI